MNNPNNKSVFISGAGVAGLTCAIALAQKGFQIRVFEKFEKLEPLGAGLQLSPNAMHVLDKLGLGEQIRQIGTQPGSLIIANGITGKHLSTIKLGKAIEHKFGNPYLVIHRSDLQAVLLDACRNHNNITLDFSGEVENFNYNNDLLRVTVSVRETIQEYPCSALVVADGVWSRLRTHVLGLSPARYSHKIAWRALIPSQRCKNKDWLRHTHVWLGPNSHVVFYPVSAGDFLNVVIITDGSDINPDQNLSIDSNMLRNHFSGWGGDFLQVLNVQEDWTGWPLFEHGAAEMVGSGPVVLAGDAAHAMLPFAAQGAAMAIEDAGILADEFSSNTSITEAAKSYSERRLARVNKVMKFARSNGNIYHFSGPMAFARDLGMRLIPDGLLAARQDWIYGWTLED